MLDYGWYCIIWAAKAANTPRHLRSNLKLAGQIYRSIRIQEAPRSRIATVHLFYVLIRGFLRAEVQDAAMQ